MRRHHAGLVAMTLVLAACGTADEPSDTASPTPTSATATPGASTSAAPTTADPDTTQPSGSPTLDVGPTPEASMSPSLAAVVAAASEDVLSRTGATGEVRVVSAEEGPARQDTRDWCEARGTVVADASFRVVVGIDERVWVYLAGPDGAPVLCPTDEPDQGTEFLPPPGFDE